MKENSFKPFVDEFAKSLKVRNLTDRTIKGVRWRLGKFFSCLESCGITHIDQITKEAVAAYQIELYQCINKNGAPNTVSYQNNMLSAVFLPS